MDDQHPLYSIGSVARLAGVSTSTLRNWERRYGVPKPSQLTAGGQRLYSRADLAAVVALARRKAAGLQPGKAAGVLLNKRSRPELLAQTFLAAAEGMDAVELRHILGEAEVVFTPDRIWYEVVAPALRHLGEQATQTGAGIGAEHLTSSLVMTWLRGVLEGAVEPQGAPRVVVACGPGELHELGSLMFVRALRGKGLRALYAGANSPLSALIEARRMPGVAMLCVTATMAATAEALVDLLPDLEQAPAPASAARLAVAGPGFQDMEACRVALLGAVPWLRGEIEQAAGQAAALLLASASA
jgi:DNA-binding transcriptional MerR regulator